MSTFSGRKRSLRGPTTQHRSFCSSLYARTLRCELLEDRRLLAQITVTSDQDNVDLSDGVTSLREAIFAANIVPGADEIVFDFGHDGPAKILLTQGELRITDALTITGPGAELLSIDNSLTQGPIFNVDNFTNNTAIEVSLSGMTLTGSEQSAIRSVENLTVDSMIFRGNSGQRAGGISVEQDGGQALNAKLTVRNCHFADNHATSTNSFSAGGGILFNGRFGELTVESSTFVGNSSAASGGGLGVSGFGNLVNITDCEFTDNQALRGGGVFIADDNSKLATLTRTDIFDNTAAQAGGGLFVTSKAVTIVDSQIGRNRTTSTATSSTTGGGGIFKQGGDAFVIRGSMISENRSLTDGGGIALVGSGLQLSDSVVNQNAASRGGGISLLQAASVEVSRSTLSGNTAEKEGGGLYSRGANTNLRILDSTVSGNSALGSGGGLSVGSGSFLLHNSTVSGNGANFFGGGLVIARGTRQTNIEHSTITNNTADVDENGIGRGGGLFSESSPAINIRHTIIAGNHDNTGMAPELHADFVQTYSLIGVGAEFLGPLADNGGPTKTHALLPGSPAIDAGDPAVTSVPKFDQRFYPFVRVYGSAIDIGAFEAQSLVVDTLVDENDGDYSAGDLSLREAIDLANRIAGPNTIEFSPLLAGGTNLMTMGEYAITDAVEIVGLGAELLTIDSQQQSRIFNVTATTGDFAFSGMTLTKGSTSEAGTAFGGGAIRSASTGLVSLHSMHFYGNRTLGNDAGGGAVFAVGAMDVEGSVFLENTTTGNSAAGGAIYAAGDLAIARSNLNANQTFGPNAGGGGVFALKTLTTDATGFINNRTNGGNSLGGGINASTLVMASSAVSGNSTNAANAPGGGISVGDQRRGGSPSSIVDSIILDNYTVGNNSRGGGISAGVITIERSTISGNFTTNYNSNGGGLYALAGTLRDSAFVGNRTYGPGSNGGGAGGGDPRQEWQISNSSFVANETLGSNSHGGALYLHIAFSVTASNFEDNSAPAGGGGAISLAVLTNDYVSIYGSKFTGNSAGFGGAIASQGNTNIVESELSKNRAVTAQGSLKRGGGAIFQDSFGTLSITRSKITENQAIGNSYIGGGGIQASQTTIVQSEISNNRVIGSGAGGGVYSVFATISDSTISGNQIVGSGRGGGVFASGSGQPISVLNSTISGNRITGEQASGAGIHAIQGVKLRNSTVAYNRIDSSTGEAGGLWITHGGISSFPSTISHSIIAGNSVGSTASDLLARPQLSYSFIGTNTGTALVEAPVGSPDAQGNLIGGPLHGVIDPLLAPLADNGGTTLTHALLPGSPAINAGDPTSVSGANGITLFDQRGAPFARVAGGRIDIGAYESQPAAGLFSADFDGDGDVDGRDFLLWQRGHGKTAGVTTADGDAMADGDVDGLDLVVWQEMYGAEPPAVSSQVFVDTAMQQMKQLKSSSVVSLSTPARDQHVHVQEADEPLLRAVLAENLADCVFDHWLPPRRTYDFGDIVTHRPAKRRA